MLGLSWQLLLRVQEDLASLEQVRRVPPRQQ